MKYLVAFILLISCSPVSEKHKSSRIDLLRKANFYYDQEDYMNAKLYFDTLISMNPFDGELYFKRGYSESMLLKSDSAIKDYMRAINYDYRRKSAYLNIGVILFYDSLFAQAIPFFDSCLKLEPDNQKAKELKAKSAQEIQ